jgi:flagellin-like protein
LTRIKNVRNTTKFKRSIKAISPVIATLLMIAIAVVASLVVYAWVNGYMGFTTSKAGKAIQIQSYATTGTNPLAPTDLLVYVQNVGQSDVQLSQDQSVYLDSNLVTISVANPTPSAWPLTLPIDQTVELKVQLPTGYQKGDKVDIKVTTTDGTFMTATGTPGSGSGGSSGAVATKLAFSSGGAQSLTVNVVSGAIVVQRQDDSNAPVSAGTSAIIVTLSSSGAGTFYSDAGTTPLIGSQITIAAGASSATFYYKATAVGTSPHTLTAVSSPLASATSNFPVSAASSTWTLTINKLGTGSVYVDGVAYTAPVAVPKGNTVSLSETPGTGKVFGGWYYDTTSAFTTPISILMDGDKTVTAVFGTRSNIFSDNFDSSTWPTTWILSGEYNRDWGGSGGSNTGRVGRDSSGNNGDGSITANVATTGYYYIQVNYDRSAYNIETTDHYYIDWSIGTGTWTNIEDYRSSSWVNNQVTLQGAQNVASINLRFMFDNFDTDENYGLMDNVSITGITPS